MRCTITYARDHLGALTIRAQDPREVIVLTRYEKPVTGIKSATIEPDRTSVM